MTSKLTEAHALQGWTQALIRRLKKTSNDGGVEQRREAGEFASLASWLGAPIPAPTPHSVGHSVGHNEATQASELGDKRDAFREWFKQEMPELYLAENRFTRGHSNVKMPVEEIARTAKHSKHEPKHELLAQVPDPDSTDWKTAWDQFSSTYLTPIRMRLTGDADSKSDEWFRQLDQELETLRGSPLMNSGAMQAMEKHIQHRRYTLGTMEQTPALKISSRALIRFLDKLIKKIFEVNGCKSSGTLQELANRARGSTSASAALQPASASGWRANAAAGKKANALLMQPPATAPDKQAEHEDDCEPHYTSLSSESSAYRSLAELGSSSASVQPPSLPFAPEVPSDEDDPEGDDDVYVAVERLDASKLPPDLQEIRTHLLQTLWRGG